MKGIKKTIVIVLVLLLSFSLYAVTFSKSLLSVNSDAHLLSNSGNAGYLGGFFPLEADYLYKVTPSSFMTESGLSVNLNLSSGIKERLLKVSPENGEILTTERSDLMYQVHYIYADIDFSKTLIEEPYLSEDILALHFSILVDYENAYERFNWLSNPVNNNGVFTEYESGGFSDKYSSYSYVPEVGGNRRLKNTGFGAGVVLNFKEETEMTKDGLWGSLRVKYMPSWMPLGDKKGSNYVSLNLNAGFAMTLLEMSQMSFGPSSGLDALSVYVETDFDVIGAWGRNIPQRAVERRIWGSHIPSSHMVVANTTSLFIKGYQIMKDLYPSLSIFSDIAFAFGGGINNTEGGNGFIGSVGARIDFNIFSMFSLYGEVGYVYKDLYDSANGLRYALGAKVRI